MRLDTAAFNCPEKECTATIPGTEKSNLDSEAVDQPEIKPDNPYFFKKDSGKIISQYDSGISYHI
jgi:hypothetical protein